MLVAATAIAGAVSAPLLDAAIRAHVAEQLDVPQHDVDVVSNGLGTPLSCGPAAALDLEGRVGHLSRGRFDLRVRGVERGEPCADLRLRVHVEVWVRRPVAARSVPAGGVVDLETARVELGSIQGESVDPARGPYQALAPLRKGQPVTLHRVRPVPDRKGGAEVVVVSGTGGLQIRVRGKLLEDARTGSRVRVAVPATGGVVEGVLLPDGTVRVGPTP